MQNIPKAAAAKLNDYEVLIHPLITEKAVGFIEKENKISFIVNKKATKSDIKRVIEKEHKVKVIGINILRDRKGKKKAFVKLSKEFKAENLATKLGVI